MAKQNTNLTAINLYKANTQPAKLLRQNGKFTHSFTLPIKQAGATLILLRSTEPFTEEELKEMLLEANNGEGSYKINYYQLIATCDLTSQTLSDDLTDSLTTTYRTNITVPSGVKTDSEELFVANSLVARATRQASRAIETSTVNNLETGTAEKGGYLSLVLFAAINKSDGSDHVFTEYDGDKTNDSPEVGDEDIHEAGIVGFIGGDKGITEAQILGYFPKDRPDFAAFIDEGFKITVSGKAALSIAVAPTEDTQED